MNSNKPRARVLLLAAFIILSTSGAWAQVSSAVERVITEEVKLSISATDSAGRFASSLSADDLVISEDGRLHRAQSVRRAPANVVLMVDTGAEMGSYLGPSRQAAAKLIASLQENDRMAVFQMGDSLSMLADWTPDKMGAADALKKLGFAKRSAVDRSIQGIVDFFDRTPMENRHLVMITNGLDSFKDKAARSAAVAKLLASDITVHVLSFAHFAKEDIRSQQAVFREGEPKPRRIPEEIVEIFPDPTYPGEKVKRTTQRDMAKMPRLGSIGLDRELSKAAGKRRSELEAAEDFLNSLVSGTGGIGVVPETTADAVDGMAVLAESIDSRFIVTYVPRRPLADSPPGEIRDITITSKGTGIRVQSRRKLLIEK